MKLRGVHFIILFLFVFVTLKGQNCVALTLNIRYDEKKDSLDNWHERKKELTQLLSKSKASIIGLQEVLHHQLEYIDHSLPKHLPIGVGREDGKTKGEYSPLFIDTTVWEILKSNTFWLSSSPEKVSIGWDAAMERICTYAILRHKKSSKQISVFNTHFDHIGNEARIQSVKLIDKMVDSLANTAFATIIMGDFNLEPNTEPIQWLSKKYKDTWQNSNPKKRGQEGTFNGFGRVTNPRRIDYILSKNIEKIKTKHLPGLRKNKRFISDHMPVLANFLLI